MLLCAAYFLVVMPSVQIYVIATSIDRSKVCGTAQVFRMPIYSGSILMQTQQVLTSSTSSSTNQGLIFKMISPTFSQTLKLWNSPLTNWFTAANLPPGFSPGLQSLKTLKVFYAAHPGFLMAPISWRHLIWSRIWKSSALNAVHVNCIEFLKMTSGALLLKSTAQILDWLNFQKFYLLMWPFILIWATIR